MSAPVPSPSSMKGMIGLSRNYEAAILAVMAAPSAGGVNEGDVDIIADAAAGSRSRAGFSAVENSVENDGYSRCCDVMSVF